MPYARVRGADLFYSDSGEGDVALVFIHGWTCDSHDWSWQLPEFAGYRVIALDLRGHGRSSAPDDGYTVEELAADVVTLIEELEVRSAVLVGHSLGGVIASLLAASGSPRIAAAIALDPPYGFDEEGAERNLGLVNALREGPSNVVVANFLPILEGPSTPSALITWHHRRALGMQPHVVTKVAESMHGSMDAVANMGRTLEIIQGRSIPFLAIHITLERQDWESGLMSDPRSRSVGFPGAGHWLHQERPAEVNAAIAEWLGALQLEQPRV